MTITSPETRPHTTAKSRTRLVLTGAAAAVLAVDVATKLAVVTWARSPLDLGPVRLHLMYNRGLALGIGYALPLQLIVALTAVAAIVVAAGAWTGRLGAPLPAGMFAGGAVANLADRLVGGSVVDFVDIGAWPVFNLADVALVLGLFLLTSAGNDRRRQRPEPRRLRPLPSGGETSGEETNRQRSTAE